MTDFSPWGAAMTLESAAPFISEEELREALYHCFNSLAWKVTSKGGPGGVWDGKYVNAVPDKIVIEVRREDIFRMVDVRCYGEGRLLEEINRPEKPT